MKKVLLIDSGSGGANVLLQCVKNAPFFDYLLFCDNKNLPYGNKSKNYLLSITLKNLRKIKKVFDYEIVIFACNTLTATCLEKCKEKFSKITFLGVTPALEDALEKYEERDVVVVATEQTLINSEIIRLHKNVACKIIPNLAMLIDKNLDNLECLEGYLKGCFSGQNPKAVVLGCTHYVAILEILKKILPKTEFFSGERRVAEVLKSLKDEERANFQVQFLVSKEDDFLSKMLFYFNKKSEI